MIKLIFSGEDVVLENNTNSIFLAGPTKRNGDFSNSWRKDAVYFLQESGFDGCVFIPEYREPKDYNTMTDDDYAEMHNWEWKYLERSTIVMFWVPRDIANDMPAFTTNVEFGFWISKDPDKVVFGYPKNADNMSYLQDLYNNFGPDYDTPDTLKETVSIALTAIDEFNKWEEVAENTEVNEVLDESIEDAAY